MINLFKKHLTLRVLVAIFLGIIVGYFFPQSADGMKFLSDVFAKLIKMLVAPIIFLTVVLGVGSMGDLKSVGRLGGKTLLYFEVVSTFALALGLVVAYWVRPGENFDISNITQLMTSYGLSKAPVPHEDIKSFLLQIIPDSVVGALARGDTLSVLLFAMLFGTVLAKKQSTSKPLIQALQRLSEIFFGMIELVMVLSPLAAFGAMAYTVGKFGLGVLWSLGTLVLCMYLAMTLFVVFILGGLCWIYGISLAKLLYFLREELLLVLATSSSESALPRLMLKLQKVGCSQNVVGLVIPTGYSFNLDGTSIYLSMAVLFIAQAYHVKLGFEDLMMIMMILIVTSKGSAGVTGAGFVTLAATLASIPGHPIPPEGIALVVGVDRFLSEARAITNIIGNSVATVLLAKSEGSFLSTGIIDLSPVSDNAKKDT